VTIAEACELAAVSRAGFYRNYQEHEPRQADIELRDRLQRLALENSQYGYRRLSRELRRQGCVENAKRVLRLMRLDNLLCERKKRYVLTTDSDHFLPVYPNLAGRLVVDGLNQLWVADITYLRLREQFIYLAVILDAFSRRVIGWQLGESLEATLAVAALEQALRERQVEAGLVHHSDRGVQYCCREYVARLEAQGILISMSRRGNPYDNARAESFMKTLKSEEVGLRQYRDIDDARQSIGVFLEQVYNGRRLHSALDYRPPLEFEQALAAQGPDRAVGRVRYEFSKA
jgi:transposase InsO family protein